MYTEKELKEMSENQLAEKDYKHAAEVFNGLTTLFGKE